MAQTIARGLHNFISDIRNSADKEAEQIRVEKELANIRQKFSASKELNSYHKKKYTWKLVYIFVLGYDVDFGHMEAISLMLSQKYPEKVVGYAAVALMVHPLEAPQDLMDTVISAIKQDLGRPDDGAQSLALACIANMGGQSLAGPLADGVKRLLVAQDSHAAVKKKAALCLLRLYRTNPECVVHLEWCDRLASLMSTRHTGVLTSVMSLVLGLASRAPMDYGGLVPHAIRNLHALVVGETKDKGAPTATSRCRPDYLYYQTPCPWLQIKLLKFLQFYPTPVEKISAQSLATVLARIVQQQVATDSVNKSNADHAVLFEAVNLIIHQGTTSDPALRHQVLALLGRFIQVREPNIRYLGLETMARLAQVEGNDAVTQHEATVLSSLKDADISVRRRALDLLFVMCDASNTASIVGELVAYLVTADVAIREEMVLKIAIVAEKYATDLEWYVSTVLRLIELAGDQVADDVWHRLVQIITNHKPLQHFAADKLFKALEPKRCCASLVELGAYVLGEFGFLIAEEPHRSGEEQLNLLMQHWPTASVHTQAQMLSALVKMANLYEECRPLAAAIFAKHLSSAQLDLQQRAVEYSQLPVLGEEAMEDVLREMPAWSESRMSALEKRVGANNEKTVDGNAWVKGAKEKGGSDKTASSSSTSSSNGGSEKQLVNGGSTASTAATADLLDHSEPDPPPPPPPAPPTVAPAPPPAAAAPQAAPPAAAAPPSVIGGEVVGISQEALPLMKGWFNGLVLAPQGVLFEDAHLQVGFRHAYQAHQARAALYLKNKSQSAGWASLEVALPPAPYLKSAQQPLEGVNPVLANGATATLNLALEAMLPFDGCPECVITFTNGNGAKHRYPLRLPVVAPCFCEPVALSAPDFAARWTALATSPTDDPACPREQVATFPARGGAAIDAAVMADVASRILIGGLKLGATTGENGGSGGSAADVTGDGLKVPLQTLGAATFRTGTVGANGQKASVGVLVKLEALNNTYRLSVRAVHGKISLAFKNVVKAQLA